ncbi:MAG: RNA polymerase sigma factor [Planctomycetes bacterium]|nr:RNA polymerase sigma factor [Planctomycetota bacterium]
MEPDRDKLLLARLGEGDQSAVPEIRARYERELNLFCRRMVYDEVLAEDIVQEVMMKCFSPGVAPPTGSLRGWLYKVARNRSIDEIRKMRPEVRMSAMKSASHIWDGGAIPIDPGTTPAGKAIKQDRARRVQMAIDSMEEDLREVVILYFFQGLPRLEVAEAIGLSLAGAKARLARATKLLREQLHALDDSSI